MTMSEMEQGMEEDEIDTEHPFALNIATPWFAVMGFVMVWVLGVTISHLTRHSDPPKYKSTLVSRTCRRFVPTDILEVEMKVLEEPESKNLL